MSDALMSVSESDTDASPSERECARTTSMGKLEGAPGRGDHTSELSKDAAGKKVAKRRKRKSRVVADAVIVLKDEKAPIFQDFLRYAYPQ